jgi:hypothetical protein
VARYLSQRRNAKPGNEPVFAIIGSGSPSPVNTGDLPVNLQLNNFGGSSVTTPSVSSGIALAKGALPSGNKIVLFKSDLITSIAVQQDQETTWSDGSLKFAVLSYTSPDTLTAGQTVTYKVSKTSGTPNRAANITLAQLSANSDIKLKFYNGDFGSDVYFVSVNDIITNGTNFPWGASPTRGWRSVKAGPNCTEWAFFSYLNRQSDSAWHNWIKATIWVKAWSTTVYELDAYVEQSNTFGAISAGTVGGATEGKFVYQCDFLNGSTVLQNFGGSSDWRTTTVAQSGISVAAQTVPDPSGNGLLTGMPVQVSSSSTLPAGLSTNTTYWLGNNANIPGWQLFLSRVESTASDGGLISAVYGISFWAANTAYSPSQMVINNNISYRCITAGTSAASGGPTGGGSNITDGTVHWAASQPVFTTQGSGTLTIYPMMATFPYSAWAGRGPHCDRLWSGATAPTILSIQDTTYLTTKSKATPPYLPGITINALGSLGAYQPNCAYAGVWAFETTGDSTGDERIGYLNEQSARSILLPTSRNDDVYSKNLAFQLSDWHMHVVDETIGKVPVLNNTTYTNLSAANPNFRAFPYPAGSPTPLSPDITIPNLDGYANNGPYVEPSHMPAPWYWPYLRTGDDLFLHMGTLQGFSVIGNCEFSHYAVGATTYYGTITANVGGMNQQTRAIGWGLRAMTMVRHVMPDADPLKQYFIDLVKGAADYTVAWYPTQVVQASHIGIYNELGDNLLMQPWTNAIAYQCMAMEAWRGEETSWTTFLNNYYRHCVLDSIDPTAGGCAYQCGLYSWQFETSTDLTTTYTSWAALLTANGVSSCPSTSMIHQAGGFAPPNDPNGYAQIIACCVALSQSLGYSNASTIYSDIRTRQIQYGGGTVPGMFTDHPVFAWAPP